MERTRSRASDAGLLRPQFDELARQIAQADEHNAAGRPAAARALLLPAVRQLEAGAPQPQRTRLLVRALVELAKSRFETHGDAAPVLDRLAELLVDEPDAWPGMAPAVDGVRGLLALRAGRTAEALVALDDAIAAAQVADPLDLCRALLNRGVLHAQLRDLARARADYTQCARRADEAGLTRLAARAQFNVAHVEYIAGRLPEALARMDAAVAQMPPPVPPVALLDRARVLLEAGLVAVADATLAQAARAFAAQHVPREVTECEIARAECAILHGDLPAAQRFARSARRRAVRRGDDGQRVRASLLALQVEVAALTAGPLPAGMRDGRRRLDWDSVASRADRLERLCVATGQLTAQATARYVRLEADLACGRVRDPAGALSLLGEVDPADPIGVRLFGHRVRAMLALAAEDRRGARAHVWAGQHDLRLHRARFGSLDLRTAGAVHGTALAALDLRMALATGRGDALLEAAERSRGVVSRTPRVNPPNDPRGAQLLAQLRRLVEESREVVLRPAGDPERVAVVREAQRLKQEILARSWTESGRVSSDEPGRPGGRTARVRQALRERPGAVVLDTLEVDGLWVAARVDERGSSVQRLGSPVRAGELVRRVHADLEVCANPLVPADLQSVARASLAHTLADLDALVAPAVTGADELVVVAGGWLSALPWSMLPSRRGRPTVLAPTVRHWLDRSGRWAPGLGGVGLVAGPGLQHAHDEVAALAAVWPLAHVSSGDAATVAGTLALLSAPGLVHLAAHGRHERDNPLFSSVRLADGPLFAHELDSSTSVPDLVVLSCCEGGRVTARSGGEALGLASVLLRVGVPAVVAATAPLHDEQALRVMSAVHARLAAGEPVALAVAAASAQEHEETGRPVPLVCLGASV